jgi:O-antigen ligase
VNRNLPAVLTRNAGAVSAAIAVGWWLIEVTRAWAGRDKPSVTVGAILIAIAVALTRPDRVLPRAALILAAAVSIGAFVVPLTADTGWRGAPDAAIYTSGVWLALIVATVVAGRPDWTVLLYTLVVASAAIEFISGWEAWWGGEDPTHPMLGTFYWHNPYAAFLIPGGLLGLGCWIWRERLFALLGIVCFSFATIGIVYSTSRASLACFVLGFVLVAAAALVDAKRWRALRQLAIAVVIAAAATFFVGGPPFFPSRSSPLAAEQTRTAGQSLGQNGGYRLDFWRESLTVFGHHPLTGGGYKSLVAQSIGHVPASWPLSPYAHNGYLQALGDGGLVLGIPFLLAGIAIAFLCVRRLVRGLVQRRLPPEQIVVAVALACLMLHSGVDFDWTYAADFAMAAILAGFLLGQEIRERAQAGDPAMEPAQPGRKARVLTVGCLIAGIALLGVSAWVIRDGNHNANLPLTSQSR